MISYFYALKKNTMPRTRAIMRREDMDNIINRCEVCYLGMSDEENNPYVLPFNFGYRDKTIYLHSARTGKKMDIMTKNPKVCLAFSTDHVLRFTNEEVACSYGMKFRSVVLYGKIKFIDDFEQKKEVMNIIMQKYTGKTFPYNPPSINEVAVYNVVIEEMTGRESGY
jgi:uncharacterized protein